MSNFSRVDSSLISPHFIAYCEQLNNPEQGSRSQEAPSSYSLSHRVTSLGDNAINIGSVVMLGAPIVGRRGDKRPRENLQADLEKRKEPKVEQPSTFLRNRFSSVLSPADIYPGALRAIVGGSRASEEIRNLGNPSQNAQPVTQRTILEATQLEWERIGAGAQQIQSSQDLLNESLGREESPPTLLPPQALLDSAINFIKELISQNGVLLEELGSVKEDLRTEQDGSILREETLDNTKEELDNTEDALFVTEEALQTAQKALESEKQETARLLGENDSLKIKIELVEGVNEALVERNANLNKEISEKTLLINQLTRGLQPGMLRSSNGSNPR